MNQFGKKQKKISVVAPSLSCLMLHFELHRYIPEIETKTLVYEKDVKIKDTKGQGNSECPPPSHPFPITEASGEKQKQVPQNSRVTP